MKPEKWALAGLEAQGLEHGSPLISVIIPLYCEGANLPAFLADVKAALEKAGTPFELILIDDGSPDDTWKVISDEARRLPAIRAVRLSRNFGKELALCAGLERARGDAIVLMDGDGQHPPALLPDMLRLWQTTGADIVEAIKIKRGPESLSGKFGALLFYIILNKLSGFDLRGASDFKLMNRKAINAWLELQERNVFFRGMTAWLGFTTVRIPFEVARRSAGKSSWSYLKRLRLAITGLTAFSSFPLQLVTLAGADLLCLCRRARSADAVSETGGASRQRFRDGHFTGTDHRQFADDQPRHRGRIPGPHLRRSKRPAPLRGDALNRAGY